MVVAKTASSNVAFKAGMMIESVFYTQANFIAPEVRGQDVECNADLCDLFLFF